MVKLDSPLKDRKVSFSQRLFWSIFVMFLGFTVCFVVFQYQRETDFAREKLNGILECYNYQLYHKMLDELDADSLVSEFIEEIPHNDLRVTIIDKEGEVLFDNDNNESRDNHNSRSEIVQARADGRGFAIRTSASTGEKYFYSATNIGGMIYRSALPWDEYTEKMLSINTNFFYFMLFMVLVSFSVVSKFSFSLGKTLRRLKHFAIEAEKGNIPKDDFRFPNDDLGDIAKTIVSLYHSQEMATDMKRQLTQNVAHELKTPVCSIQGYLETILANPDLPPEKLRFFIERCYTQSTRLAGLLRDISLLNRMDEAKEMYETEDVDISLLIENIENECYKEMEDKRITTIVNVPEDTVVNGNRSLLYSIFRNLFDNAIAYAGEGITITVDRYKEDDEYYYFSFSDNGVGIGQEHISRIFERFYRVDKGRSRKTGGTGLGLSIVKNSINFHKGQISAESSPSNGVTFFFTIRKS